MLHFFIYLDQWKVLGNCKFIIDRDTYSKTYDISNQINP